MRPVGCMHSPNVNAWTPHQIQLSVAYDKLHIESPIKIRGFSRSIPEPGWWSFSRQSVRLPSTSFYD